MDNGVQAQLMPVVADLEQAGVATLMLTAAAPMAEGRHDAGAREMSDIDVLVPTRAVAGACQVLADCGMRPVENVPVEFVTDYWALRVRHSDHFENAAGGQLDIHWHALRPGATTTPIPSSGQKRNPSPSRALLPGRCVPPTNCCW